MFSSFVDWKEEQLLCDIHRDIVLLLLLYHFSNVRNVNEIIDEEIFPINVYVHYEGISIPILSVSLCIYYDM